MKKRFSALAIAAVMAVSLCTGAIAASNSQTIQALLSYDITIKYNGQAQQFKNAGGDNVFPIVYEGTTYLPVRAVANLVDLPVDWDGATNTVYLGEKDKTLVNDQIWVNKPSIWSKSNASTDKSALVVQGMAHDFGIITRTEVGSYDTGETWADGYFQLGGKYGTLHIKAYCADGDAKIQFLAKDDRKSTCYKEATLTAGVPAEFDINVAGLDQVWLFSHSKTNLIITDMYLK